MNREDIIRMAREAGIPLEIDWAGRPSTLVIKDGGTYLRGVDDLERFAAAERKVIMDSLQKQADLATDALDRRWALEMIAAVALRGEAK